MTQRMVRVNELLKREISDIVHTQFRDATVGITIMEVEVAPDLRSGTVYYSVLGDGNARLEAESFFEENRGEILSRARKHVILKYFPVLQFTYDEALARGDNVLRILDELEAEEPPKSN